MSDYESGQRALLALIGEVSARPNLDRNEASTRFHIIDHIVRDALTWPDQLIRVEEHGPDGYTDYELGDPPMLVIEAKREGSAFEMPAGWDKPTCKLSTISQISPAMNDAIKQALKYAMERGVPYAAVCNGWQLVAFLASRQDGVRPIDGRALVFSSPESMSARFRQLWDTLSYPGLTSGFLTSLLAAPVVVAPPEKLSARLVDYPGFKNRNEIATDLQILGGLFLEDLGRDPDYEEEFLQATYCKSGALSQYALVSKEILQARYAGTFEQSGGVSAAPAVSKKGVNPDLKKDVIAAGLSRRPIILVGDVGVGKSIFVRNLVKVEAKHELERAIVIYVDFGTKPALASDLTQYVSDEIARQLHAEHGIDVFERNFVRGVYHGEILRFSKGIHSDLKDSNPSLYKDKEIERLQVLMSDADAHLKACINHVVRGEQRQVVLFLDNVDQRPAPFQEQVFLIAHSLADQWPMTVFVSLRPETFSMSKSHGTLAAYQPRVFTISPPRVDLVIAKRIEFAMAQLKRHGRLESMPEGLTFQSSTLELYLQMLQRALREQTAIIEFIDNLSAGNVRAALRFVADFVGSGHVDSYRILEVEAEKDPGYFLPIHEFMRAVTYGDLEYFDPALSPVLNVYDIASNDGREHFLCLLVLAYVERLGQLGGRDGYAERNEVLRFTQQVGYHPTSVRSCISRCLEKNLLATPSGLRHDEYKLLRITSAGAYTFKRLAYMFAYVDAVIVDTPIVDSETRARIHDVRGIMERLDRAVIFIEYLERQWDVLGEAAKSTLDWHAGIAQTRAEIARIRGKLESGRF